MSARRDPDPIHNRLTDRLDDWVLNALAPQDLARALKRVLEIAYETERQCLRWEHQLEVPTWVSKVRAQIADELDVKTEAGAA